MLDHCCHYGTRLGQCRTWSKRVRPDSTLVGPVRSDQLGRFSRIWSDLVIFALGLPEVRSGWIQVWIRSDLFLILYLISHVLQETKSHFSHKTLYLGQLDW